MEKLDLTRENLRKFGITMGTAFIVITLFILWRHKYNIMPTAITSGAFFLSVFLAPDILKPVYFFWMSLAFILGWINTRLILFAIFYLVFTPIGLILRLFGKDLLEKRIDRSKVSYWKQKESRAFEKLNYERQF